MKKISLILALLVSSIMVFGQVKWMSVNEALEAQKKNPKKIMIKFYADWCGMCKRMDRETLANKEIINYLNENYYAVKFNAEGNEPVTFQGKNFINPDFDPKRKPTYGGGPQHQFVKYFGITGYPTTVFLDETGQLLTGLIGYFKPRDLEAYLGLFATNDYKNIKTQEEWKNYREKFKHKVKE